MFHQKDHIQRIQKLTFEAYKTSGRIAVLLDEDGGPSGALARELERAAAQMERGAVEMRALCAQYQPPVFPVSFLEVPS